MKFRSVEGSLGGMIGNISYDQDNLDICSFDVCIDATSIDTGNTKRDEHLNKEDFFDTHQYGTICFTSSMTKKAENGSYAVIGDLTIREVTKRVMIPFTFDGDKFTGNMTLNRLDYGVGSEVGELMVGNEVNIQIVCSII